MYRSKTKLPGAWICTNENERQTRGRVKIHQPGSKIYLKDGDESEIELFNPTDKNIKAQIDIDGKSIASGGIVLRPGERIYLECFPDSKKKFTFQTYQVENTDEVKQAIRNNGRVSVKFYREKVYTQPYCNPITYPWPYNGTGSPYWIYYGSTTTNLSNSNITFTTTNTNSCDYTTVNLDGMLSSQAFDTINISGNISSQIETGQVNGGDDSGQEFEYVYMEFIPHSFKTYEFQILPISQKPLDKKSFKKNKRKKRKSTSNKLDELMKLKDLLENDLIDRDEFDKLKSELL